MYTGNPIRIQESGSYHGQRPSKPFLPSQLATIGQRHVRADELEGFLGLKRHYTRVGKLADGSLIVVDNLNRLKCLGGGIDARQVSPLLAGMQQQGPRPVHTHVKPHRGWNTARMAKWLTKGPLPITDDAPAGWAQDWHMHGVDDLVRCAIQGFPLRYNGDRTSQVEAPNGPSAERNPESTQRELDKELDNGHIIGPWDEPPLKGF